METTNTSFTSCTQELRGPEAFGEGVSCARCGEEVPCPHPPAERQRYYALGDAWFETCGWCCEQLAASPGWPG
jgi:hypothetical protein